MKTLVKMHAAYMEEPVTVSEPGDFYHWPTHELPVSEGLRQDIQTWDDEYQSTLDQEYPPDSKFPSDDLEREHSERGKQLALRLQEELGEKYSVEYKY